VTTPLEGQLDIDEVLQKLRNWKNLFTFVQPIIGSKAQKSTFETMLAVAKHFPTELTMCLKEPLVQPKINGYIAKMALSGLALYEPLRNFLPLFLEYVNTDKRVKQRLCSQSLAFMAYEEPDLMLDTLSQFSTHSDQFIRHDITYALGAAFPYKWNACRPILRNFLGSSDYWKRTGALKSLNALLHMGKIKEARTFIDNAPESALKNKLLALAEEADKREDYEPTPTNAIEHFNFVRGYMNLYPLLHVDYISSLIVVDKTRSLDSGMKRFVRKYLTSKHGEIYSDESEATEHLRRTLLQQTDIKFDNLLIALEHGEAQSLEEMVNCSRLDIPDITLTNILATGYTSIGFNGFTTKTGAKVVVKVIHPEPQISSPNQKQRFANGHGQVLQQNVEHCDLLVNAGVEPWQMVAMRNYGTNRNGGGEYCWIAYRHAGLTLRQFWQQHSEMKNDMSFVTEYFHSLSSILKRMHLAEIAHRDLKPENVFVRETSEGRFAVIGDYDTPMGIPQIKSARNGSRTYEDIGNPGYMSPEGCVDYITMLKLIEAGKIDEIPQGSQTVNWIANDIYCFGSMMFEALANRLPAQRSESLMKEFIDFRMKSMMPSPSTFYQILGIDLEETLRDEPFYPLIAGCLGPEKSRWNITRVSEFISTHLIGA
jgi:hypothetical protein